MSINICDNLGVSSDGHLLFAGQDTVELAAKYGTPLYLMDEDKIKENCRRYSEAFERLFRDGSRPLFASKACSFKHVYEIMTEEGMGIDVVSPGEIFTAVKAGYDMSLAYFHGNNKTDWDVSYAMDCGVGYFVADNHEEVAAIEREAAKRGICQKILVRVSPGIDPHTYEAISTGKVDSKFGVAIETGQADILMKDVLSREHIKLMGIHCHLGSQVFAEDVFERAVVVMTEYAAHVRDEFGYTLEQIDLGGGYGVRYVDSDPYLDVTEKLEIVADVLKKTCERLEFPEPLFFMEPGRSIVADAGMTLYTMGTLKRIPGYKNYVSIDGGMPDNPRYALYRSNYTCLAASKMNEETNMKAYLVGRCCESGDIIQADVDFPETMKRGDIVAVCTTGAYNYSMASNYNRIPRPPIVMLKGGDSFVAVRRESFEDLCLNDL